MSGPLVRSAESAEDITLVGQLFRAYGDHLAAVSGVHLPDLDREIASLPGEYVCLLLATMDGYPAGCVGLRTLNCNGERACEPKRLWVSPPYRGLGLGRLLMEASIRRAESLKVSALYLDTIPDILTHSVRVYEALGFTRVARYNTNRVEGAAFFRLGLPVSSGPRESR